MTGKNWRFKWILNWGEIDDPSFQNYWLHVFETADSPSIFMHPCLAQAWLTTYRKLRKIEPYFIIARKGNAQVFFPLLIWNLSARNVFLKKIIPVGYADFDYTDPLYINFKEKDERQNFWNELSRIITLENILKKFDFAEFTGIRDKLLLPDYIVHEERCPRIDISRFQNSVEFIQGISGKLRKDLNRRQNRLEELGVLEFKVLTSFEEISKSLSLFYSWHKIKWPNAFIATGLYENVIKESLKAGILHYSILTLNNKAISIRLGFYNDDTFFSYIPVYNSTFAQYSPGKLHLLSCICWSIEKKLSVFDHLRGDELYKKEWAETSHPLYTYSLWNPGFTSSLKKIALNFKVLNTKWLKKY
jgi:hypothetical protein